MVAFTYHKLKLDSPDMGSVKETSWGELLVEDLEVKCKQKALTTLISLRSNPQTVLAYIHVLIYLKWVTDPLFDPHEAPHASGIHVLILPKI